MSSASLCQTDYVAIRFIDLGTLLGHYSRAGTSYILPASVGQSIRNNTFAVAAIRTEARLGIAASLDQYRNDDV